MQQRVIEKEDILTTGCNGMMGKYVDFGIQTDRTMLDITNLEQVRMVCQTYKPKAILHLAAATDLTRCKEDPDYAYRVNAIGTYNVALVAKEIGAKVVFISTTSVFDGKKS